MPIAELRGKKLCNILLLLLLSIGYYIDELFEQSKNQIMAME